MYIHLKEDKGIKEHKCKERLYVMMSNYYFNEID